MTKIKRAHDADSAPQLQIATDVSTDGTAFLILTGEIDLATADDVQDIGFGVLSSAQCVTLCVDLAGVVFLDSTGISALLRLRAAALDAGRTMVLRNPSAAVTRLLHLTGLTDTFDVAQQDVLILDQQPTTG